MKHILPGLCLVMLAMNAGSDQQAATGTQAQTAAAKAAIKDLAGALQKELKGAMKTGGSVAAIGLCYTRAMPITQEIAINQGLSLGRVSLNNRNPANQPNEWQAAVLKDFEQQKSAGKDIGALTWSETVSIDGEQEFRFMKAIPTQAVCLNCHGTDISPEVSQILAIVYPDDRATGYQEGDIRGAFVATRKFSN
ncbi:MAG: DUF3365 domain-containing protein [Xanthomonadales bacterium]|nr:DUF3365 domain-containing protein [Xanthomonadales bacterium]